MSRREAPIAQKFAFFDNAVVQCLTFTFLTFLFVTPRLWRGGINIVTNTYRLGTLRFLHGSNPYALPLEGGDRYEYSPFFCVFYSPFALLPSSGQALAWAFANGFLFWVGVLAWVKLSKKSSPWIYFALVVCSMELNISVLYQQVNALLIGATLFGVALFRDGRLFWAGALLATITNLKTLPGLFALALIFPFRRRYWEGLAAGSLLTLLSPIVFVGLTKTVSFHTEWVKAQFAALAYERPYQLDLGSVLKSFGSNSLGHWAPLVVLALSVGLLFYGVFSRKQLPWASWLGIGSTCLLLASPRSESPTFVLIAPTYLLVVSLILHFGKSKSGLFILASSAFFITICFTDLWSKKLWDPGSIHYASKTFGTLALWLLSVFYFFRERRCHDAAPIRVR